ncbi:unnamed protein product [Lactuca virosa]|uniref:60S ribosomal protein L2, mitochondrial n=1 Tax=Lactuca virosa TaxID=75947 RepID=A0AAU9LX87_9ASTR|nr:unnamed protein product [Lactuca virosa]
MVEIEDVAESSHMRPNHIDDRRAGMVFTTATVETVRFFVPVLMSNLALSNYYMFECRLCVSSLKTHVCIRSKCLRVSVVTQGKVLFLRFQLCWDIGAQNVSSERPLRQFVTGKDKSAGRNSKGRITIFHRGGGAKRSQRTIDLKRNTSSVGVVERIEYDPNRTSRVAVVRWVEGAAVDRPKKINSLQKNFTPPPRSYPPSPSKDVFLSAFSSSNGKKRHDTPYSFVNVLGVPRMAVAGAKPEFFVPRMKDDVKENESLLLNESKSYPAHNITLSRLQIEISPNIPKESLLPKPENLSSLFLCAASIFSPLAKAPTAGKNWF